MKQGSVVPGTVVILHELASQNKPATKMTDAQGQCMYRNLSPGKYRITLQHRGTTKQIPSFHLKPGFRHTVGIVFLTSPRSAPKSIGQLMGAW